MGVVTSIYNNITNYNTAVKWQGLYNKSDKVLVFILLREFVNDYYNYLSEKELLQIKEYLSKIEKCICKENDSIQMPVISGFSESYKNDIWVENYGSKSATAIENEELFYSYRNKKYAKITPQTVSNPGRLMFVTDLYDNQELDGLNIVKDQYLEENEGEINYPSSMLIPYKTENSIEFFVYYPVIQTSYDFSIKTITGKITNATRSYLGTRTYGNNKTAYVYKIIINFINNGSNIEFAIQY